jgi:hypothetical protein
VGLLNAPIREVHVMMRKEIYNWEAKIRVALMHRQTENRTSAGMNPGDIGGFPTSSPD